MRVVIRFLSAGLALCLAFSTRSFAGKLPSSWLVEDLNGGGYALLPPLNMAPPGKGQPLINPGSNLPLQRLTTFTFDINNFLTHNPVLPPINMEGVVSEVGDLGHGVNNGYCKYPCINVTGRYLLAARPGGLYGVWDLQTSNYVLTVAYSLFNGIGDASEPRWSRLPGKENWIIYHVTDVTNKTTIYTQDVTRGLLSQTVLISDARLNGQPLRDSGQEGDFSWNGRYMAGKFGWGKDTVCGLVDLVNHVVLPGYVKQDPNAVDVDPDGRYLLMSPHETENGDLSTGERFIPRSDLERGGVAAHPVLLQSKATGSPLFRSVGHNGWAYDADGREVFLYQDNRDDFFSYAYPEDGIAHHLFYFETLAPSWDMTWHVGAVKNPACKGWALVSLIASAGVPTGPNAWWSNQLMFIEIKPIEKKPRMWRLGPSENFYNGNYFTECWASITNDCRAVTWTSNWNGKDALEIYKLDLPAAWWETLNEAGVNGADDSEWMQYR